MNENRSVPKSFLRLFFIIPGFQAWVAENNRKTQERWSKQIDKLHG